MVSVLVVDQTQKIYRIAFIHNIILQRQDIKALVKLQVEVNEEYHKRMKCV